MLRAYLVMLRFDCFSNRGWLPMWLSVQLILALGSAMMYGFYIPNLTPAAAGS